MLFFQNESSKKKPSKTKEGKTYLHLECKVYIFYYAYK